jgi:lipopolysaccharide export system protein LptA
MKKILTLLFLLVIAPSAFAETKKEPLVITADGSLEWHRDDQFYIARKNALATQGQTKLQADTLRAAYIDGANGSSLSISRIEAQGRVQITTDGTQGQGDTGYYDIKRGFAELTGKNLSLKTKTDEITARDAITYDTKKQEMIARGQARAVRGEDVITADVLTGRFLKDAASGQTKLSDLSATGQVVITTPEEVLYGDAGRYNAVTNIATITGNVRIERGQNVITGAKGEVDLNTNISRIFGGTPSPDASGTPSAAQVRGVFYPE